MEKPLQIRRINKTNYHSLAFDNLVEFDEFVDSEITQRLSKNNKEVWQETKKIAQAQLSSDWFGYPNPKSLKELEEHKEFQNPDLFKEVETEIKKSLEEFSSIENPVPQKKIAYNSLGFGVFSFDRASIGLKKIKTEKGEERITTSVKDVYAYFRNKQLTQEAVKIYLVAGGLANVNGKEMLYTGMGAVVLADYLTERGYSVEITIIIESRNENEVYLNQVRVKKFEDTLDKNLIAVLSGDPKYYRYKGFKAIISIYNHFGKSCPESLGGMVSRAQLEEFVRNEITDDSSFILFMAEYSLEAIKSNIISIIHKLKRKEQSA